MKTVQLDYHLHHLTLIDDYQLDVHTLPSELKGKLSSTKEAMDRFNKHPSDITRDKVIKEDTELCESITNWVDEVCKVLEG